MDHAPERANEPPPAVAENVHRGAVRIAGGVLERADVRPALPHPEERVLRDVLGFAPAAGDREQNAVQARSFGTEEFLERCRRILHRRPRRTAAPALRAASTLTSKFNEPASLGV